MILIFGTAASFIIPIVYFALFYKRKTRRQYPQLVRTLLDIYYQMQLEQLEIINLNPPPPPPSQSPSPSPTMNIV